MVLRAINISPYYIYFFLKSEDIINKLQQLAESRSGTFPQITFNQVRDINMILPQSNLLEIFTEMLKTTYDGISKNNNQINILSQIRDSLLPKLMSGKIRVK